MDAGSTSTTVDTASTTVDSGTSAAVDTQNGAQTGQVVDTTSTVDPNDPMAALQQAMDAQLGLDEPAAPVVDPNAPAEPQIPEAFAQALQISDFVKEPAHIAQAVAAADEVWKVASGQAPASALLEGMRAANPQGFEAVIGNLVPYIEQVTGKKFGDGPATPPDPNQARLSAIEQKFAEQEQERANAAWNQQVQAAHGKAMEFLTSKAKGTFAEGNEAYFLQQIGARAGVPEQEMVQMLLQGKTDKIEAAYKAVVKDETARLKAYNVNLIKQHRTLANGVPAVPGSNTVKPPAAEFKPRDGESTVQTVKRLLQG